MTVYYDDDDEEPGEEERRGGQTAQRLLFLWKYELLEFLCKLLNHQSERKLKPGRRMERLQTFIQFNASFDRIVDNPSS